MRIGLAGNVNTFGDAAVLIEGNNYTVDYDAEVDVQKFTTLDPDNAPSDGPNMLKLEDFEEVINEIDRFSYSS